MDNKRIIGDNGVETPKERNKTPFRLNKNIKQITKKDVDTIFE